MAAKKKITAAQKKQAEAEAKAWRRLAKEIENGLRNNAYHKINVDYSQTRRDKDTRTNLPLRGVHLKITYSGTDFRRKP